MRLLVFLWLIVGAICAYICFYLAKNKGLNESLWGFLGFFIGPIAILFVAIAQPSQEFVEAMANATKKKCWNCAEFVQLEAQTCRFCGAEFDSEETAILVAQREEFEFNSELEKQRIERQERSGKIALLGLLGFFVLLFLFTVAS